MLKADEVESAIAEYRDKLLALRERFDAGERTTIELEAMAHGDALICLMEEAPLHQRRRIDYLIDRFESLRASCLN